MSVNYSCVVPDGRGGLEYISTERVDSRQTYCIFLDMWVMQVDSLEELTSVINDSGRPSIPM